MRESEQMIAVLGIAVGIVLLILGLSAYIITDFASVTALIPAFFGAIIVALGAVVQRSNRPELAVYGLGVLALLGILGSLMGIPDIISLLQGEEIDSVAPISQGILILLSTILLIGVGKYMWDTR